jgi:hypothetical protein
MTVNAKQINSVKKRTGIFLKQSGFRFNRSPDCSARRHNGLRCYQKCRVHVNFVIAVNIQRGYNRKNSLLLKAASREETEERALAAEGPDPGFLRR